MTPQDRSGVTSRMMRRLLVTILVSGTTILVVDLILQTTLARFLWPIVVTPADGSIAQLPVVVRWEGTEPLLATLSRGGRRVKLGLRYNPFEIEASSLPKPGQYSIELRSPRFGRWVQTERRFFVRETEVPPPTPQPAKPPKAETRDAEPKVPAERQRVEAENAALREQSAQLRLDVLDLEALADELKELQIESENRLGVVESQQAELLEEHLNALEENQLLRARLQSLPGCTTWGYLSYPRPQTSRPTRRVVVSNGRGEIFHDMADCHRTQRTDPTAASPCACVGSVWN